MRTWNVTVEPSLNLATEAFTVPSAYSVHDCVSIIHLTAIHFLWIQRVACIDVQ